jgi:hypothetical protein
MSNKSIATVATTGIDIGKKSFHIVALDPRSIVLRQKWSRGQVEVRLAATSVAPLRSDDPSRRARELATSIKAGPSRRPRPSHLLHLGFGRPRGGGGGGE